MFVDIKNVHDRMFANIRNTYLEKYENFLLQSNCFALFYFIIP